jgi:hypothetical protein
MRVFNKIPAFNVQRVSDYRSYTALNKRQNDNEWLVGNDLRGSGGGLL